MYCRNKVVAAALLLFGLISTSRAGITITAPSVSEAPLYWSGTNCRIYFEAQATGNDSIGHFKLTLENESGDEVIKEETYGTNPSRVLVEKAYKAFCISHNQSNYPADAEHTLHVWGDFAAKLVGVYTGIYDQEPITNWIREL